MRWKSRNSIGSILTPVLTFIFGVIGGKLLDAQANPLFSNEIRAIMAGLFTLGILISSCLILIATFSRRAEKREQEWRQTIRQIKQQIGTPVDLIFERFNVSEGQYFRTLTKFIQKISSADEILVMTYHRLDSQVENKNENNAHTEARQLYYEALLEKAKEPGVIYRRILGFDEGPDEGKIQPERVKQRLINHCSQMLVIRDQNNKHDRISVKKAKATFGADFLIIGKKLAAISIDVYEPTSNTAYTAGSLVFHNPPNGHVIEQLHAWFMETDGRSIAVSRIPE